MKARKLFTALSLCCLLLGSAANAQTKLKASVTWNNINSHPCELPIIGQVQTTHSDLANESYWSVGCETLDRDYSNFDKYKEFVGQTGVGYARLQSGWAKTEQKKGKYNFEWLDAHVNGLLEQGVHPWICLCYGNPVYSNHGYDLDAKIFPDGPIMDAWLKYVRNLVSRYKGKVTMYEVWNEPDNSGAKDSYYIYGNLLARTAQVIKEVDPDAKVAGFGACSPNRNYIGKALEKVKEMGQLDKIDFVTYHGYKTVPEVLIKEVGDLKKDLNELSPKIQVLQGETGCPGQLEYGHALCNIEWTEYSQAKWDLRNMMIHFEMGVPYSVFTMVDLNYGWMMQSFGLVRMQLIAKPVYLRPKFHAVQHMTSIFGPDVKSDKNVSLTSQSGSNIHTVGISKVGKTVGCALWCGDKRPDSSLERTNETIRIKGVNFENPVYVDVLSGTIHQIPADRITVDSKNNCITLKDIPVWDSPVLIINHDAVNFSNEISSQTCDNHTIIKQTGGATLGYSETSGVDILYKDGFAFKDLNKNGRLDIYEDWREPVENRAKDLASKMTLEQICGLMLYSSAQTVKSSALSEVQKTMLGNDNIRHMLVAAVSDPRTAAQWSNAVQQFCESAALGIPSNNSSDPRNYTNGTANVNNYVPEPDGEFNPAAESDVSKWPREVGLAATFDMDIIRRHGLVASAEYRAIGITTALSPQADMASEPRWRRFYGTFSEDPYLLRDIVQTYCEAFQTTEGSETGWGDQSVNCMVKHWPGGGPGEGGRDGHFGIGKYAVYPGGRFDLSLVPFTDGAFNLPGKTAMASAVMPYYTVSYGQDPSGENVANGFSHYIIQELLRDKYRYQGVVCTDWGIVGNYEKTYIHAGKPWGVETLTPAEKRLRCFEAGVDQLGGAKDSDISIAAYHLWEEKYGAQSARERFELSARRLLTNIFNVGVFENPYVDPEVAAKTVGCKEFVQAGYDAQLKSIVMLKNAKSVLPMRNDTQASGRRLKVYEPLRHVPAGMSHWQHPTGEYSEYPISKELLGRYFEVVDTPEEADFAIVSIKSPYGHWGYVLPNEQYPEGHYQPISLQWGPYTADKAREQSIAGGDPKESVVNRSYKGFTEISSNEEDMHLIIKTKKEMGDKPVITIVATERPFVPAEIEPYCDAILVAFGVCNNSLLDIISGKAEPYGLLPCQMPADMETVELQCEDVPRDMKCYIDSQNNTYDFAFGLNWSGVINDSRVQKYK